MSAKEVYTYTCEKHPLGELVREVGAQERDALQDVAEVMHHAHFTNCWVKGCQLPLVQVRRVAVGQLT